MLEKPAPRPAIKPGVTKGKQWIRLNKNVELLDTPGILWPKFEDQTVGLHLACIGSIKDELLQTEELALELCKILKDKYPGALAGRYQIDETKEVLTFLEQIAENRNCRSKGNQLDYSKAALLVIDDFRSGTIGKISLEFPEKIKKEETEV